MDACSILALMAVVCFKARYMKRLNRLMPNAPNTKSTGQDCLSTGQSSTSGRQANGNSIKLATPQRTDVKVNGSQ